MKVEEVRIDSISNHSKNPKQHPEKQLRLLEFLDATGKEPVRVDG